MKVAVIGPVAPFRSGIARHTTAIVGELAGRPGMEVAVWSFSRQYPRRLFPGGDQVDPGLRAPNGVPVHWTIDTLNPASWLRTAREVGAFAPDLVIIPAWTFFVAPALGWIARDLRRNGIAVTMVVHNAFDHEEAAWKGRLMRFQLRQAGRLVVHNDSVAEQLGRHGLHPPVAVCPHPLYDDYPEPRGDLPRRAPLELLFFGLVRPYKGLDTLLRALATAGRDDVRLTVAGEFWSGLEETRRQITAAQLDSIVDLIPRYVTDDEAAELFARADVVVAPYRTATGSGVLALAQRYLRPVVASDIPPLREAIAHGTTGWLFPAGDSSALASLLAKEVSSRRIESMKEPLAALRGSLSWSRLVDAILG
jgi:glycosyltransferase involved in cell wall biosynthesis